MVRYPSSLRAKLLFRVVRTTKCTKFPFIKNKESKENKAKYTEK